MANTIQIRRHSSNTDTSAPGSLLTGELALNQADKKFRLNCNQFFQDNPMNLRVLQMLVQNS